MKEEVQEVLDIDPYKAPGVDIETAEMTGEGTRFFPVSIPKLTSLYLVTFGIYSIVWFYENWKIVRDRLRLEIWPVPRAIFYIFFAGSLFTRIKEEADDQGVETAWSPGVAAVVFVLFTVLGNALDRIAEQSDEIGFITFLSIPKLIITVFPLINVQRTANQVNGDPEGRLNSRFTPWNVLFFLLFGFVWLLFFLGVFVYFFNPELSD